jgi:uncharacterized protein YbaR (Trm112 family)
MHLDIVVCPIDEHIVWLEVTVHHTSRVHERHATEELVQDLAQERESTM